MSKLHIYAFGSICRGDIDEGSDVDLLAVVSQHSPDISRAIYSVYSHKRLSEIWIEGNPFAWHLHKEARLIFTQNGEDYISSLGSPSPYARQFLDCEKFLSLLREALASIEAGTKSVTFDLSTAFLAVRNFSSCYLLGNGDCNFSRNVGWTLMGEHPPISEKSYRILERSRILCTRGYGNAIHPTDVQDAIVCLPFLDEWMQEKLRALQNGK
jgi:Nucleotidyltransferase domain